MTNADLLQRTLAHIEAHPDEWNQDHWAKRTACGTSFCFAGTAVHLTHADARFLFDPWEDWATHVQVGRDYYDIEAFATDLLGLDEHDAKVLFAPDNDLDRLRHLVADLVDGRRIDVVHGEVGEAVDAR